MVHKVPFLPTTNQIISQRNFGYSLSCFVDSEQQSSLSDLMAYSAKGLQYLCENADFVDAVLGQAMK